MVAEPKKDRTQLVIWIIGLVFLGGMAFKTLQVIDAKTVVNANNIDDVEAKADANREAIHKEELARTEMVGTVNAIAGDMGDVKDDMRDLKEYLMEYDFGPKRDK
jgi:hypothetical protein